MGGLAEAGAQISCEGILVKGMLLLSVAMLSSISMLARSASPFDSSSHGAGWGKQGAPQQAPRVPRKLGADELAEKMVCVQSRRWRVAHGN